MFRIREENSCLLSTYSCLWAPHFTYFISSVVSTFKVKKQKPREGKRLPLVTQPLGGRIRTEPWYPELLVQGFLSIALPPGGALVLFVAHAWSWRSSLYRALVPTFNSSSPLPLFPGLSLLGVLQTPADSVGGTLLNLSLPLGQPHSPSNPECGHSFQQGQKRLEAHTPGQLSPNSDL